MAVLDRLHPDVRSGAWPRMVTSPRVFAHEVVMHGLFGAVMGGLLDRPRAGAGVIPAA